MELDEPSEVDAVAAGGVAALAEAHGYVEEDDGAGFQRCEDLEVHRLLLERVLAKRSRAFDVADALRDRLRQDWRVVVDDRVNTFRVGGRGRRPEGHGYRRDDDGSVALTADDVATLDRLLVDRIVAKRRE